MRWCSPRQAVVGCCGVVAGLHLVAVLLLLQRRAVARAEERPGSTPNQQQQQQHQQQQHTEAMRQMLRCAEVASDADYCRLRVAPALSELDVGGLVFDAGHPVFPRFFARDSLLAGMLLLPSSTRPLAAAVAKCAQTMGRTADPRTGEEPGKVVHELPGQPSPFAARRARGLLTTFNAADSTALFVIAAARLHMLGAGGGGSHVEVMRRAVDYLLAHVETETGLFLETPARAQATDFALPVTFWKDSRLVVDGAAADPVYPVAYTLVQAQAACALRCAGKVLRDGNLTAAGDRMAAALVRHLLAPSEPGRVVVARDGRGLVTQNASSDALFALWFLQPGDVPAEQQETIRAAAQLLRSPAQIGLLTGVAEGRALDRYHLGVVWPFENAFMHAAARRARFFELAAAAADAGRVLHRLDGAFPERIRSLDGVWNTIVGLFAGGAGGAGGRRVEGLGSDPQLWTVAAAHYLNLKPSSSAALGAAGDWCV